MGERRKVLPACVERVRKRIEHWRRTRRKRTPIPASLWMAAVELARNHGVSPISRSLRLDYYSLKRRLVATEAGGDGVAGQGFVEVDLGPTTSHEACQIEVSDGEGATMMIRASSSSSLRSRLRRKCGLSWPWNLPTSVDR